MMILYDRALTSVPLEAASCYDQTPRPGEALPAHGHCTIYCSARNNFPHLRMREAVILNQLGKNIHNGRLRRKLSRLIQ